MIVGLSPKPRGRCAGGRSEEGLLGMNGAGLRAASTIYRREFAADSLQVQPLATIGSIYDCGAPAALEH
jgi:hypothetical protein